VLEATATANGEAKGAKLGLTATAEATAVLKTTNTLELRSMSDAAKATI